MRKGAYLLNIRAELLGDDAAHIFEDGSLILHWQR
jgi:hypothetical protein